MTLLDHIPDFHAADAAASVAALYGFQGSVAPLPSERDQNFMIDTGGNGRFVFKIANALEDRAMLECQNQAMLRIAGQQSVCPQVVPTRAGETIVRMTSGSGREHWARLVTYLNGIPLGRLNRHSDGVLRSLGQCLGRMDRSLAGFDHAAAHRHFHWDLAEALDVVDRYGDLIADAGMKSLVDRMAADFRQHVAPVLAGLRRSVIHNDANDYNVIVAGNGRRPLRNPRVVGIIDFGDLVYSHTVGNLAVAVAYAILEKSDPLASAVQVVCGYHREFALGEDEIGALFGLVCMRLCTSVCMAAHQVRQRPDDPYLNISQAPIRTTLPRLAEIRPAFAEAAFRQACGMVPVPAADSVGRWLAAHRDAAASVIDTDNGQAAVTVLDLSVGSPIIASDPRDNREPVLTRRINDRMAETGATIGIGRYDEPRLPDTPPDAAHGRWPTDETPTVHLGMDFFAAPGTPVHAPLPGRVHALDGSTVHGAHGPVIILAHRPEDGPVFYTVYGRLSEACLTAWRPGQAVARGERIGTIAAADANGGRTPGLHFQIVVDLMGLGCAFPGRCLPGQRRLWTRFSPDPNLLIGIPAHRFPQPEIDKADTLAARRRFIGPSLSIGYSDPVKIKRGWMQYLYDENGRRYLDAYNNVPHVGHCHPRVLRAGREQMGILSTNTRYLHDLINTYAERLCATMPDPLSVCFFVNSATEGNELALRLARNYTGRRDMIVLEAAYHGHTTSLIDISPYKHDGPGGTGAPAWVHTAPVPDRYRGPHKADDPAASEKYAEYIRRIIEKMRAENSGPAGFIAESCPSVAGQIFLPEAYLSRVYATVREAGGLCIADEVQTGYGRTGTHFYAFQEQDVVPDIVVLGKPIGNGHPVSAVVTTAPIADAFDNGMEFFSTFGGNTVSCAIGLEVLNVVLEENLQAHALRVGRRLMDGLGRFRDDFSIVGDVRGRGLFAGVELVRDRETLEPAGTEAAFVVERMREKGILLGTDGPFHNVVKIRPPMPFSEADADLLVATMHQILAEDFED